LIAETLPFSDPNKDMPQSSQIKIWKLLKSGFTDFNEAVAQRMVFIVFLVHLSASLLLKCQFAETEVWRLTSPRAVEPPGHLLTGVTF
jgi:hypothetical protein